MIDVYKKEEKSFVKMVLKKIYAYILLSNVNFDVCYYLFVYLQ